MDQTKVPELEKYMKLLESTELQDYLDTKSRSSKGFLIRYKHFVEVIGKNCDYANACVKALKEDIDEFFRGRKTDSS